MHTTTHILAWLPSEYMGLGDLAPALPLFYPNLIYLHVGWATTAALVRDSSAVERLLWIFCRRWTSERYAYGKQRICFSNSGSAHFHVSWLSDFIFYQKPLYKSLHQSFFYSFITILPSESGATLHYSTILP